MRRTLPFELAFLVGCSSTPGLKIRELPSDAIAQGYRLLARPVGLPRGETSFDCGPESIGALLQYWGKTADVAFLSRQLVHPELKSTSTSKIAPILRKMGLSATLHPGSMLLVKESVDAGKPPIVAVRLSPTLYHYYVISGYNDRTSGVLCEERDGCKTLYTYEELDRIWRETGYYFLSIELSSAAADYDAGAEYERAGNYTRAEELFRRALGADPSFHEARLGLGNCLLASGKLEEARFHYEEVLRATPDDPKIQNNLAHVYAELGLDLDRAEELAGAAVDRYTKGKRELETALLKATDEITRAALTRDLKDREIEVAFALGTLGQVRFRRERWELAIAAWKASADTIALDWFDFRAKRYYEIALANRKLGMHSEARKHLGLAREIVRDPQLKAKIEEALR